METIERKRGAFLIIILIILGLDALSGLIIYFLVILGHQKPILDIPFWMNYLFVVWAFIDIILLGAIWMWKKWAVIAEGLLLLIGFVIGLFLKIPVVGLIMTPILFGILLLALKPKWDYLK